MNLATRVIALAFAVLGLFLLFPGDAEGRRLGLAALLFAGMVGFIELGLWAHGIDLDLGARRRADTPSAEAVTFGPVRVRLGLSAASAACFGATPMVITGSVFSLPSILLGGPPMAAAVLLAIWAADPRPVVSIDREGICDRRTLRGMLPWGQIDGIALEEDGLGAVMLNCRDAEPFRRGGPAAALSGRPDGFLINTLLLDGDAEEVFAAASRRRAWGTR